MAFYQGARHILAPQPIVSPAISLGVLVVSALFEGWSFAVGFREYKRVIRGRDIPLWSFIKASKIQVFMGHSWRISPRSLGSR